MNTMDVKHMRCFGPCLVYEWDLGEYRDEIIRLWRKVNLLSVSRGVNRFQGLAKVLKSIHENYTEVEGLEEYLRWTESAQELSDKSLEEAYAKTENICMKKALDWSRLVNQSMAMVSDTKKPPFEGTEDALRLAREYADIVILTAANRQEINKEWEVFELAQYTDLLMSQETGRKEECLKTLLEKGYEKDHVLMVGDAPADLAAAQGAGVLFYPILAYQERESWEKFSKALECFTEGRYAGAYQEERIKEFQENLHIEGK
ncbi:MAG TPA: HAD hydrolase-like protein [Candidatus Blautia merdigallinarum]|uniref:HAD hydrolase-like protein n=1 Tax=Candidatus Blautia merdigallinarum TaxID=2838495 RepID=A0A9D2N8P1_9FIRM|nr:HAD hydrolase-like protein [Candidatus Blautia merdigallinarum]